MIRSSIRLERAHRVNGSCLSTNGKRAKSNEREHYKLVRVKIKELGKHGICYCFNQEQRDDIINGFRGLATWKLIDEIYYIKEVE